MWRNEIMNQPNPSVQNDEIWRPLCRSYQKFLKIRNAARVADVTPRIIYRYIESGVTYAVKIAGKTTRVCSGCLLKRGEDDS
jgi:hypothetical protein